MKRSEAINIIRDTYNYSADVIDCMTEHQAELILNQLEKIGMLPPEQPIPEYKHSAPNEWESE